MGKRGILKVLVCLAILIIFVAGCSQSLEQKPAMKPVEEVIDTGILFVKSAPSPAQVYINGELKGDTPLELSNFPVGKYEVVVKKGGYSDFEKPATVKTGLREEVEASLNPISKPEAPAQALDGSKSTANEAPETAPLTSQKLNTVDISKSFIIYYDFKKALFTEETSGNPDAFSSNYGAYVYFTAIAPSTMCIVNKQIKDFKKEDCPYATDTIGNLHSGQTLCVKTKEGLIAAIGGSWKDKPSELQWILFS